MVSKYGKDSQVPKDFPSVLKAFTREVLRSQPTNVYEFGAAYFQQLLAQAQSATAAEGGAETRLTPAQMEQMLIQLFKNADVDGSGDEGECLLLLLRLLLCLAAGLSLSLFSLCVYLSAFLCPSSASARVS